MSVRQEILSTLGDSVARTSSQIAAVINRPAPSVRRYLSELERSGHIVVSVPSEGPLNYSVRAVTVE